MRKVGYIPIGRKTSFYYLRHYAREKYMTGLESTNSTSGIKSFVNDLGIDLLGIADLKSLNDIPVGLPISPSQLFQQYPYAIVLGAQYGKPGKKASGDETALYLEKAAYDIMGYLESRHYQYLVIHPEDEFDPKNRMGLLSLKILAKQAGIGWQGKSLLIISPKYGPIHRLIAVLTNMPLVPDMPVKNMCGECKKCVDACPKKSLSLTQFDDHPDSREEVLNLSTCLGDNGCMICILKCPHLEYGN